MWVQAELCVTRLTLLAICQSHFLLQDMVHCAPTTPHVILTGQLLLVHEWHWHCAYLLSLLGNQREENKIKKSRKMALLTCVKNVEWLFVISASTGLEL